MQQNRLAIANMDLQKAQAELDAKQAELDVVQADYEKAMMEKQVWYFRPKIGVTTPLLHNQTQGRFKQHYLLSRKCDE